MSGDKVLQDVVSVGTTQAAVEHLCLAAQCLLGQPAHVSHCRDRADTERAIAVCLAPRQRLSGINAYNSRLDHHLSEQMQQVRHREGKLLVHGHTAGNGRAGLETPGGLAPESTL